jgi:hypothetical protein
MDEADADRVADVGLEDGRHRVAEHPGAVVLLLVEHRPSLEVVAGADQPPQPALAVDHRLGAVGDRHDRRRVAVAASVPAAPMALAVASTRIGFEVAMRGHELGLVVEDDDELAVGRPPEVEVGLRRAPVVGVQGRGRLGDVVGPRPLGQHVEVQPVQLDEIARAGVAVRAPPGHRVAPGGARRLHDQRAEEAMHVGAVFLARVVPAVVEREDALVPARPAVGPHVGELRRRLVRVLDEAGRVPADVGAVVVPDVVAVSDEVEADAAALISFSERALDALPDSAPGARADARAGAAGAPAPA